MYEDLYGPSEARVVVGTNSSTLTLASLGLIPK